MNKATRLPSLRWHKPTRQGVVTLSNQDFYCGKWPDGPPQQPPAEVRATYDRHVAEWLARGRRPLARASGEDTGLEAGAREVGQGTRVAPATLTVAELLVAFLRHAQGHYRDQDGRQTSEMKEFIYSLRPVNHLYGGTPAAAFGPLKLKAVRDLMVRGYEHPKYGPQPALARGLINKRVGRVVRVFKWAASEEMVPAPVHQALATVGGLQRGRTSARETAPVKPVAVALVDATLPHLPAFVASMVQVELFTGMRPAEVCNLRLAEIDRTGNVWVYRPANHKTAWRGKERVVPIGPRAQEVLRGYIRMRCPCCGVEGRPPRLGWRSGTCGPCADRLDEECVCGPWPLVELQQPDAYLFSPALAREERYADLRAGRQSKVQPSQQDRKRRKPKVRPGDRYRVTSYAHAVRRACEAQRLEAWHPNQLRHTHGTEVRRRFGLEAAQAALGHAQANVTEIYAERDLALAVRVATEIG
jgi:integrase